LSLARQATQCTQTSAESHQDEHYDDKCHSASNDDDAAQVPSADIAATLSLDLSGGLSEVGI